MDIDIIQQESESFGKRKGKRISYYSKIYCSKSMNNGQAEEFEEPVEMTLRDVSEGGLGVVCSRLFEKGSVLVLSITLEEVNYQKVTAKVMWTIKKDDAYRHGLEVMNLSGKLYRHLSKLDNSITTTV
ncbi:MAG TPA: PilZ domain-containing protein [Clostridia bacterium]|nr:PilZ domain-containing protein [Clostridia bacterium]